MHRKLWKAEKFHPVEIDLTQEERGAKMDINTERQTKKGSDKFLRSWPDSGYIYRGGEALGRFVSGPEIGPVADLDTAAGVQETSFVDVCTVKYATMWIVTGGSN